MSYEILLLPIVAGFFAQFTKYFIRSNNQKLKISNMMAYSGMPSSHSAIVSSLSVIIGLREGFNSALFAIAFVVAVITIRDALGIRQYLGQHGRVLNILVKDLDEDKLLDEDYPHLLEKIGHTPAQVIVGCFIGIAVSAISFVFIK